MVSVPWWVKDELDEIETIDQAEERLEQLQERLEEIDSELIELEEERRRIPVLIDHLKAKREELALLEDPQRALWRQAMRDPNQIKFPWVS
ncbi:MAG: hypothetical protein CW346_19550 [Bacillaceae bacterium]|nr:hypothetical protein [Bacillaceae bacterium]